MSDHRQQAGARFGALFDAVPDGLALVDDRGTILDVNARFARIFARERGAFAGRPVSTFFTVPDGAASPVESRGHRPDGREFPIEICTETADFDGRAVTVYSVRDTSDRTRADQRFRALLESAPDAMVIVDRAGTIVLVNAQTERVFGYRREEMLGRSVEMLVPERYGHGHVASRQGYFTTAHPRPMGMGLELFGRRKDGSEVPVEISLSPLETEEGVLVASAIRDITERKAAEAERAKLVLERAAHADASRIKDEFIATVSHELRTPLNSMLGWSTLINTGSLPPEAVARAHATISRNARSLAQLVDDLLDVSRIVSGKLRLQTSALDLTDVADAAMEVVQPAAAVKEINLHAHYQTRPVLVVGDADRLQQVIWNLLSNAIKFTPPHGRVELAIRSGEGYVEIVVRDTGEGIAPGFLPHVFDRFRQSDSSSTRPHGGLGLGLAIARSIVELHGGKVSAASSGLGLGSTFRVELPVAALADRRSRRRAPASLEALERARVLIVDDQPDERELLTTIFEQQRSEVRTAGSVREAFALMAAWRPDLVVSDLAMPQEDGYVLIRRLRQTRDLEDVPVVAVTAHARMEDRDAALSAGFRAYISKPIDRETLLSRAASVLAGQAARVRKDGP